MKNSYQRLLFRNGKPMTNFVGRFENLQKDFYFNESHVQAQQGNQAFSIDDAIKELGKLIKVDDGLDKNLIELSNKKIIELSNKYENFLINLRHD